MILSIIRASLLLFISLSGIVYCTSTYGQGNNVLCNDTLPSIAISRQRIVLQENIKKQFNSSLHSIEEAKHLNDSIKLTYAYAELGNLYMEIGAADSALPFLNIVEKQILRKPFPIVFILETCLQKCKAYFKLGSYDTALNYAYRGLYYLDKNDKLKHDEIMIKINFYHYISVIFFAINNSDKTLLYLKKAEALLDQFPDPKLKVSFLILKGGIAAMKPDFINADPLQIFTEARDYSLAHNIEDKAFSAMINMSVRYYELDSLCAAVKTLKKAFSLTNVKSREYLSSAYSTMGEIYYTAKDYNNAIKYFELALNISKDYNSLDVEIYIHQFLYKIYRIKGNYSNALAHFEQYQLLKERMNGKELAKGLLEMEEKYKTAEKDRKIVKQQLQISQQQNKLKTYSIISGCIIVTAVILLLLIRIKSLRQLSALKVLRKEQQIGNLKAVLQGEEQERSRIAAELHDGIGAKVAIAKLNIGILAKKHPEIGSLSEVLTILEETTGEIRETSHNLLPNILVKNTLREALIQYCNRINSSVLQVCLQYEEGISDFQGDGKLTLYRILQELLQNIIKHAQATKVFIQIREHEDSLRIIVEDNGQGFDPSKISGAFGLENVKNRVEALGGTLFTDSDNILGSTFFMKFPLYILRKI